MKINFKKMSVQDDERTVSINGDYKGVEIKIKMSLLQLAVIWGVDKNATEELDRGFGSEELEDKCEEVRNLIKKFPKIKVENNKLVFEDYSIIDETLDRDSPEKRFVSVFVEDIVGWGNEGIEIKIPKDIYYSKFEKKKYLTRIETVRKKLIVEKDFIEIGEERK